MASRRRFGVKGGKIIYAKEWGVEGGDNIVILWYASNRIWRERKAMNKLNSRLYYKATISSREGLSYTIQHLYSSYCLLVWIILYFNYLSIQGPNSVFLINLIVL